MKFKKLAESPATPGKREPLPGGQARFARPTGKRGSLRSPGGFGSRFGGFWRSLIALITNHLSLITNRLSLIA